MQTGSIEVLFMSFARWLAENWNDRSWMPTWIMGAPVRQIYNPAMHASVGALIKATGWSPAEAYHFVTTLTYCLGPVTLFWLVWRGTRRLGLAFLAGLIYSVYSPAILLDRSILSDVGSYFSPRRLQTLITYGEGPHVTGLMEIPLVIWLLHEAATRRRWAYIVPAALALALLVCTNWTTTTGFVMALAAYVAAKFGTRKIGENPLHWPTFLALGVLAYAVASPWIPPSLVRSVQESSTGLDIATPTSEKAAIAAGLGLLMVVFHSLFQRRHTPSIFRFFVYYALISGTAVLSKLWFGKVLVPISHRFQLELEMALAGLMAYGALAVARRLPKPARIGALVLLTAAVIFQVRTYHRAAHNWSAPADLPNVEEAKIARGFTENFRLSERVFASGTVSLWLNLNSDLPQFYGCCDQTVRSATLRAAIYQIYSGDGSGDRESEIAIAWLKTYGVSGISVQAPNTSPYGEAFAHPHKFDGKLPEAWRQGESVIFRIPRINQSLAHVIARQSAITRAPYNGIDIQPLEPLLHDLDNPTHRATLRWINQHEAEITAETSADQVVFLQETCDPGWRAFEGSRQLPMYCDAIGLTLIEPATAGPHTIHIVYGDSPEDTATRYAQAGGLIALIVWTLRARRRELQPS
ncbi:MAG: hypothetical protein RL328_2906 [Acidobacteriota bacterium]